MNTQMNTKLVINCIGYLLNVSQMYSYTIRLKVIYKNKNGRTESAEEGINRKRNVKY